MRKIILAACLSAVATGLTVQSLHSEEPAKNKAYLIAEITVTDPEVYKEYAAKVPATFGPWGGQPLSRGGTTVALEGAPPAPRVVVIEFPNLEAAKGFWNSPAYQAIIPLRHKASKARAFIVEGTR